MPTGRVIGINAQIETTTGTNEGVGFAIPIDLARRALDQLLRTGKVRYAYIGVSTQDVTPGIARAFGLGATRGALVTRVDTGSPADAAGLRGGGRTEAFNGLDLTLGGDLIVAIGGTKVDERRGRLAARDDEARARSDRDLHGAARQSAALRSRSRSATVRLRADGADGSARAADRRLESWACRVPARWGRHAPGDARCRRPRHGAPSPRRPARRDLGRERDGRRRPRRRGRAARKRCARRRARRSRSGSSPTIPTSIGSSTASSRTRCSGSSSTGSGT